MTSASALTDSAALLLFQNIREGLQSGRIADLNTVQTEVDAAIAELNSRRPPEEPTSINGLVGKLFLEIGSLHEKVTKCEAQLADFQFQADVLKEDTTQIVARTEACGLLVGQQQKENAKVLAAMEEMKATVSTTPHPCIAPAPSPTDPILRLAPSRVAVVSFPGGPRTVTIHPPDSPSYQSIIRDEKGDVIIDFRRTKPLRREGAFRGPLEDINWHEITRVCGRGPEQPGARVVPPSVRWPDRSQPSSLPPPSRGPSDLIARQRQLSTSMQTDPFGRVLAPEYLSNTKSPSLPTGMSSSSLVPSSQDSPSSLSANLDTVSTSPSTPPSPSDGRGKKRTRNSEEDKGVPVTSETAREEAALSTDPRRVKVPMTPTPAKREEFRQPEGPAKRKKLRASASSEGLSTASGGESLACTHNLLDLTRTV